MKLKLLVPVSRRPTIILLSTFKFLFTFCGNPMKSHDFVVWSLWYLFSNTDTTPSMSIHVSRLIRGKLLTHWHEDGKIRVYLIAVEPHVERVLLQMHWSFYCSYEQVIFLLLRHWFNKKLAWNAVIWSSDLGRDERERTSPSKIEEHLCGIELLLLCCLGFLPYRRCKISEYIV